MIPAALSAVTHGGGSPPMMRLPPLPARAALPEAPGFRPYRIAMHPPWTRNQRSRHTSGTAASARCRNSIHLRLPPHAIKGHTASQLDIDSWPLECRKATLTAQPSAHNNPSHNGRAGLHEVDAPSLGVVGLGRSLFSGAALAGIQKSS